MKRIVIIIWALLTALYLSACNDGDQKKKEVKYVQVHNTDDYDPQRGEGKYDESNVVLGSIDPALAKKGENISASKCYSCHKLSDERLVGPGWAGVTERRKPYWILNFITNPDPMIEKDPEVQAQLELCLIRMPNQNLSEDEATAILEFMRQNDAK